MKVKNVKSLNSNSDLDDSVEKDGEYRAVWINLIVWF